MLGQPSEEIIASDVEMEPDVSCAVGRPAGPAVHSQRAHLEDEDTDSEWGGEILPAVATVGVQNQILHMLTQRPEVAQAIGFREVISVGSICSGLGVAEMVCDATASVFEQHFRAQVPPQARLSSVSSAFVMCDFVSADVPCGPGVREGCRQGCVLEAGVSQGCLHGHGRPFKGPRDSARKIRHLPCAQSASVKVKSKSMLCFVIQLSVANWNCCDLGPDAGHRVSVQEHLQSEQCFRVFLGLRKHYRIRLCCAALLCRVLRQGARGDLF